MARRPHKAYLWQSGKWRYHVRAGNGRIVDASEQGFARLPYALKRLKRDWPGVEVTLLQKRPG